VLPFRIGTWPYQDTLLDLFARDKRSSILGLFIGDGEKKDMYHWHQDKVPADDEGDNLTWSRTTTLMEQHILDANARKQLS
jgi:hypothetical protein